MKMKVDPKFLAMVQQLSEERKERLLSRMTGKLPRRLMKEKISVDDALALQLEIEDEQLQDWRKQVRKIRALEQDKSAKSSEEKGNAALAPKAEKMPEAAAKPGAATKAKVAAKPAAPAKTVAKKVTAAAKPKAPAKPQAAAKTAPAKSKTTAKPAATTKSKS
jgi:hypothetical protein